LLIIFDLDDTLIDTSSSIVPLKLDEAFTRMLEEGMVVEDEEASRLELKRLNAASPSAKEALAEFVEINQLSKKFLDIALHEVYENFSEDMPVFALKGAIEITKELSLDHDLAMVTAGVEKHQKFKIRKSGLEPSCFRKIIVCSSGEKKRFYQKLLEESGYHEKDVLVCGDRIAVDLSPAKELGFHTVQILCGRGMYAAGNKNDVDHTITELSQLKTIIQNFSDVLPTKIGKSW